MGKTSREHILQNLTGVESTRSAPPSVQAPEPFDLAYLAEALEAEWNERSIPLHHAATPHQFETKLNDFLNRHSVQSALRWNHPLLNHLGMDKLLEKHSVKTMDFDAKGCRGRASKADVGITAADAVLVDSGTIAVRGFRNQERSVSLLPPVHLAVITSDILIPSVLEFPNVMRSWRDDHGLPPSAVHFISAPSCTADIEQILVSGVHGPAALEVILLADSFPI